MAKKVDATVAAVDAVAKEHPDFRVEQSGSASSEDEFMSRVRQGLQKAEMTSLPLTLLILAAGVRRAGRRGHPDAARDHRRAGTLGLADCGSASSVAGRGSISLVILLVGLAVGVDYALFYLRRVREYRAAGLDTYAAVEAAAATLGRAVLISGPTVMIAMARVFFGGASTFTLVRGRHHRRRRRGDAGLAHRAAGAAVAHRRQGREGPILRPEPPQGPDGEARPLVAPGRPGHEAPTALGGRDHPAAARARRARPAHGHRHPGDERRSGRTSRSSRSSTTSRTRSRRRPTRFSVVLKSRRPQGAGREGRDRRARAGDGTPTRRCSRAMPASRRTSARTAP